MWSPDSRCGAATPRTKPRPGPRAYAASRVPATVSVAVLEGCPVTNRASSASARRTSSPGSRPAAAISAPSGPYSTARPSSRPASLRSTDGTGSGREAAAARPCWAWVIRRSSASLARAISCHTARATPENVVRGGTSTSGSPCSSQAATSPAGTVSCTGATPNPSAAPPAATIRAT